MVRWVILPLLVLLLAVGGETAKKESLEKRISDLEAEDVPIRHRVKGEGGWKHLVIYYGESDKETKETFLAELYPLDIYAFIEQGLAEKDDYADTRFHTSDLTTRFEHDDKSLKMIATIARLQHGSVVARSDPIRYTIHEAGDIGYVRLSEAEIFTPSTSTRQGRLSVARKKGWLESLLKSGKEEKLYYVSVPTSLYPQLDGDVLKEHTKGPLLGLGWYHGSSHVCELDWKGIESRKKPLHEDKHC